MDIDKLKLELPAQLADMCRFSFDYSNLVKIIEYLFNNNLVMIKEIKTLKTKVFDLEILQTEFDKIKSKINLIEKSNENMNVSFLNMKEKFFQSESKIDESIKRGENFETNLEKFTKMIEVHDTNINNLNRVVEENVKNIKKNDENIESNSQKIYKCEEDLKEIQLENIKTNDIINKNENKNENDQSKNEKQIESLNSNIAEINESINSIKVVMDKKNRDFDICINNILDNIADLSSKGIKSKNKENDANDNNLFKIAMGEIDRVNEKINTFNSEQKALMDKRDKESEMFKKLIEGIQADINEINNRMVDLNTVPTISMEEENIERKKSEGESLKNVHKKSLEKMDETIKKLMKNIAGLPNREEFDTFKRNTLIKLKKLEDSSMGLLQLDNKVNKVETAKEKKEQNINYFNPQFAENLRNSLFSDLNSSFKEMIKKEGKNLDLSKNEQILEIIKLITKHNEEINNNNRSLIDLRKTLIAIDVDKRMNNLLEKIITVEEESDRNKKKIFELNQIINGNTEKEEMDDEDEENYDPMSLKGKIVITEKLINTLNDKIAVVEGKYKSITKEIKDDIKSNLKVESIKTVNQFREKLELFTRRFEEELRNKIDQMGLNNFEKKMNTKIFFDLKDKLNRQEMQKNNNLINRKIDSLENKISKTLVDTIIDLQMDEAPLLVKKAPNNYDICASCNQTLKKSFGNTERNFYSRNGELNSVGHKKSLKSNSNHHINLNMNSKDINTNLKNNKKLPGIISYTQAK